MRRLDLLAVGLAAVALHVARKAMVSASTVCPCIEAARLEHDELNRIPYEGLGPNDRLTATGGRVTVHDGGRDDDAEQVRSTADLVLATPAT